METALIEIQNDLAYDFLHDLERMQVLRIIRRDNILKNSKQKLSERFAGCLSDKRTDELKLELNQMRSEWNRNIY